MKNRRFGKFRFCDYCISWIAIAFLLLFSIASIVLELSFLFVIFPMVYSAVWLGVLLVPQCEQFVMDSDSITVYWGKKTQTICLPSELTLIVSYADVCPPLAMRTAVGNQTHILKDQFAISILQKMPVEVALEILHRNRVQKYTTSIIRTIFNDCYYIYSFVCTQSLFDELIANRKCLLIIPESLLGVISFDPSLVNVHIDTGH